VDSQSHPTSRSRPRPADCDTVNDQTKDIPMSTSESTIGTPIQGAVAFVTGGNRGFGRALVDELLDRGAAKVYVTSRSPQCRHNERIVSLVVDVGDDVSVAAAAEAAPDTSIVVNNAGVALGTPLFDAPLDAIRAELETNLFGMIRVARAFAPILGRYSTSSLVNVLSVASWLALGDGYAVSKAAAWSATNSMRTHLLGQGTVVTALHVGYMDTDLTAGFDVPKADPRDVARQTADAIASGAFELLADDQTRRVKSELSKDVVAMYPQLSSVNGKASRQGLPRGAWRDYRPTIAHRVGVHSEFHVLSYPGRGSID
jgi:NAD(P)-dependent dehydrogenase (short-subunit alcohol dehydrogenase family)